MVDTLNQREAARLLDLEGVIRQGIGTFAAVGEALTEIRDSRLYRATDRTWGDYVERAWGFSRQRAAQLIGGAEVARTLTVVGLDVPNEREARELKGAAQIVGALEPEKQQAVAQFLRSVTGTEHPTTSQVKAAAEVAQAIDLHATVARPSRHQGRGALRRPDRRAVGGDPGRERQYWHPRADAVPAAH